MLDLTDASGLEDQAIALNIDAALTDSGETLSVSIGNIPEGSVLTLADGTVMPVTGGAATLTPDQLTGLNLTPPADFSGEIALDVIATSTDGTDTATTSGTLNVSVAAVADAPTLNISDAAGLEDQAIALNIDAALTDSGETLSITLGNIPDGAVLTLADGTVVPVTGGTATLTPDQLAGLNLTPPADFAGDIALNITATSTDGMDTATTSGTLNVAVAAVADAPVLNVADATGLEDQAIALNIDAALTDSGETLSISISNIPEGSVLTLADGTSVAITGGAATLTPDQLAGLNLTPPADFSGDIALDVTATSTDGTDTAVTSGTLNVAVTAVADAPDLQVTDAAGLEDQAIALNIDAALTDSGETLSVSISNIPVGSVLTLADGTVVPVTAGTATLTPDQLTGLSLTPPADFSGEIALDVIATSTDGTDTATTSGTLNVSVAAVADAPTLNISDAAGLEDQAIPLNIDAALTDSGETLSITLSNIPDGAVLTLADGTVVPVTGGTATLTPDQLAGLNLTPPADFAGDIALNITATSTDGMDTATTSGTLNVAVAAVADAPVLNVADATGLEDQAIALNIDAALTDSGETLSISISNIPEGSVLTLADGTVVTITASTATLTPDQLTGLQLTPPADFSGDIALEIVATSTDGTDTATTSGILNVSVTAVADAPDLQVTDAAGLEDQAIALNIDAALTDSGETLSVNIGNIPEGSVLTLADGTVVPVTGGTAILTPDQLTGLQLTPPADFSGEIALDVTATSTDGTDTATTSGILNVSVTAVADAPDLQVTDAAGLEDQAIALNIDAALTDSGETLSVTLGNIPDGAVLTLADGTVVPVTGGTATLTPDQLAGLNLTPPADFSGEIALDVTATSQDGTDTATTSGTLNVSVTAIADAPDLQVTDAAGNEDTAIALDVQSALTDTDGSETLSVSVSNIPEGSVLTLADGTVVPVTGGAATLSPDQLTGLNLTPPADFSGEIALNVTATSTDGTDTATTSGTLSVSVAAVADAPVLDLTDASGLEDQAIALNIDAALTDSGETLSISISNIPEGSVLTLADGTSVAITAGAATLSPDQLTGLQLTPPADFAGEIALDVTATSLDGLDTAVQTGTLNVTVTPVADQPTLSVTLGEPTVSTVGGTAVPTSITLDNYTVLDAGYQVTARAINLDGSLTEAHAGNVSTGNGGIGVAGLASGSNYEIGHSLVHNVSEQLVVDFDNAIIEASVSFDQASPLLKFFGGGKEQGHYDLYRDGEKVGEGDFTSSSWGGDGTFTATTVDGAGFDQIVFSAAKGYAGNEAVNIGDGSDFIITQIDFTAQIGGDSVATYPLDITAALTDTDGSESLGITLAGVPAGAVLSAGTDNGNGTWALQPNELPGLNITVPGNITEAFQLDVSAMATESDGIDGHGHGERRDHARRPPERAGGVPDHNRVHPGIPHPTCLVRRRCRAERHGRIGHFPGRHFHQRRLPPGRHPVRGKEIPSSTT